MSVLIKIVAWILSVVFHPIWMLFYMLLLLLMINPHLFGLSSWDQNMGLILLVLLTTVVIPMITTALMKPLGFISSLTQMARKERIFPYISTAIFYLWLFINLYHNSDIPNAYSTFVLGVIFALFTSFFINNFSKISIHTVGMGGLIGMLALTKAFYSYDYFTPPWSEGIITLNQLIIAAILIAGAVGTSRLLLRAHREDEIYGGYLVGFLAQILAYLIMT